MPIPDISNGWHVLLIGILVFIGYKAVQLYRNN